jgi:hypothetical protein
LLSARGSAMFFKATHASTNGAFACRILLATQRLHRRAC